MWKYPLLSGCLKGTTLDPAILGISGFVRLSVRLDGAHDNMISANMLSTIMNALLVTECNWFVSYVYFGILTKIEKVPRVLMKYYTHRNFSLLVNEVLGN